ncbi:MAG: hypothetical protein EOM14_16225, partial [Clostridia bacterium]|nr:hypothetical protein [Clostridia bacterium]
MPHFINSPKLPQGQVAVVAVGEDYAEEIAKALLPYGIRTLSCPNNHLVDVRLRAHIDLSVIHIGENRFILSDATLESGFADALIKMGADIIVSEAEFSSEYPNDAALCALAAGDRLFHNFKCSDRRLKDMRGYK